MRQILFILVFLLPVCAFSRSDKSVRINEVMADPKGLSVLPETEYVELYNQADEAVPLGGWSFSYGGKKIALTELSLPARGYVVLYRTGRDIRVDAPGMSLPLDKFPAQLANTGKELALYDASGAQVDAVAYEKTKPGVSWERVGDEFVLSEDERGGTPGSTNSIPDSPGNPEEKPGLPSLTTVTPLSIHELRLEYDKPVYFGDATFSIPKIGNASRVLYADEEETCINLRFDKELEVGVEYTLYCKGLKNTSGRPMPDDSFPVLLDYEGEPGEPGEPVDPDEPLDPDDPDQPLPPVTPGDPVVLTGEIIFSELLPNPFSGGSEYIELYNRSGRRLSLTGLSVATRKTDGLLSTAYPLSSLISPVDPGAFALLTKDKEGVTSNYLISSPEALHELKLPVLANTTAILVLFRSSDDTVIDEVHYSSKWHVSSVKDEKGVALERIDPDADSQDAANWTSASATSGYGTPGYKNSQHENPEGGGTEIETPVFSDLNGAYMIAYQLDQPGYTCRAWVFDTSGRQICEIANQDLLGVEGQLTWDGLAANGTQVRTGIYLLFAELIHPAGPVRRYKKVFLVR